MSAKPASTTGRGYHRVKYGDDVVERARQMHDEGVGMTTIGHRLGVSQYTVRDWIEYRTRTRPRPSRSARMLTAAMDGIRSRQGPTAIFMSLRGDIVARQIERWGSQREFERMTADTRYRLVGIFGRGVDKAEVDEAINRVADKLGVT